jgi:lysophospholipase L1-like esterase
LIDLSTQAYSDAAERLHKTLQTWVRETQSAGLPLPVGEGPVVALGDSLTADGASWYEHLRALCDNVTFVNLALAGDTSADVLGRLGWVLSLKPTWVFVMIGTNDSASFPPARDATVVSSSETLRNMHLIRDTVASTSARQVWITPVGVDETALRATWSTG